MEENKITDDSELTPEQLKKREKRRAQRKRKAENKAKQQESQNNASQGKKPEPQRMSNEDFEKKKIEAKLKKIERNPRASVVIYAESPEARAIAYKVDEVNMISDYIRTNMGTAKVSFDAGIELIKMFNEKIENNLENFIMRAASYGIGNRDSIKKYKASKRAEEQKQNRIAKLIASETEEEKKAREEKEKALEKYKADLEKAKTAMEKASENIQNVQKDIDEHFEQVAIAVKIRREEEAKKREEERQAKKEAETEK